MTSDQYLETLWAEFPQVKFTYLQSNIEGEIIDGIQESDSTADGIILNPSGNSHTSVAILDAMRALHVPVVEVHLSNIFDREEYRRTMITASAAGGSIAGFGLKSYRLAVLSVLRNRP